MKRGKKKNSRKKGLITREAKVLEVLPNYTYKLKVKEQIEDFVLGYLSGNMSKNNIRLIKDDVVIVEFSITDRNRCRIVFRK